MATARSFLISTLLPGGKVLVAGGSNVGDHSFAELHDPGFTTMKDFDGDGMTDFAVWRSSIGNWYVKASSGIAPMVVQWGDQGSGDKPMTRSVHLWGIPDRNLWSGVNRPVHLWGSP